MVTVKDRVSIFEGENLGTEDMSQILKDDKQ